MLAFLVPALLMLGLAHAASSAAQDETAARARMVAEIGVMARETGAQTGRARLGDAVMAAMGKVPRHRFVPPAQERFAYDNRPLPIGEGQTISQPYVVALMTDLIDPKPGDVVLEIGTGSGYQAAVLGELGYRNVQARVGDGYAGWPEAAPFDAIVVTAAPAAVPQPLIDQLKPGG